MLYEVITDNDTPGIAVNDITVPEGDLAMFTVDITSASAGSTVTLSMAPSGTYQATEGADYYQAPTFQYSFNGTDWFDTTEGAAIAVVAVITSYSIHYTKLYDVRARDLPAHRCAGDLP